MPKRIKIVATISSLNCSVEFIRRLYRAGMNVVRLNTAHMSFDDALLVINNVRAVSEKIGILIDTKGPEIRTCDDDTPLKVDYEDIIRLKGAPDEVSREGLICVSYRDFVRDVPVGGCVLIDDGHIALAVMDKTEEHLVCVAENDGVIRARKSINIPAVHVKLPALSEKDKEFIRFAAEHNLDFIAHSFVRNADDVLAVREILDETGSKIKIIAKIENTEGVENLDSILDHCYGVMVARGDLAVEIPAEQIPLIQKDIIRRCIERHKPVIVATQMLHSMIESPRPTRAEVSDVATACLDYADALMLSGETASGKYPEMAVTTMARIAEEMERKNSGYFNVPYREHDMVAGYLAKAAVKAGVRLGTKAIVADSLTGKSILALASYRGPNTIYAQVYDPRIARQLSLSYGVYADFTPLDISSNEPFQQSICRLITENRFADEDRIVVLAGSFGPNQGASYIEISTAANLKKKCIGARSLPD